MATPPKRSVIKEATDAIYNMYNDAKDNLHEKAKAGTFGAGAKVAAEERDYKRGDEIKKRRSGQ